MVKGGWVITRANIAYELCDTMNTRRAVLNPTRKEMFIMADSRVTDSKRENELSGKTKTHSRCDIMKRVIRDHLHESLKAYFYLRSFAVICFCFGIVLS